MFVVYMTIYSGTKLPPYYIGTTSKSKYDSGYTGTVLSKAFKAVYNSEKEKNPELFDVVILELCSSRKDALKLEHFWQKCVTAKTNPLYFNMAYAAPNGFFGNGAVGKAHPNYGGTNCKGHMHSYDPVTFKSAFVDHIPEGYVKGRSPRYTNRSAHNKGKHWYNNGSIEALYHKGTEPNGYVRGQLMTEAKKNRNSVRLANKLK